MTFRPWPALAALIAALALPGCLRVNVHGDPDAYIRSMTPLRVATYNTSLYDERAGGLVRRLRDGDARASAVAAVLQRVRPDIVLLNEFDHDAAHQAADLFQQRYLAVPQAGGGDAIHYPYRYLAPVNTGVPSGLDLDRDGQARTGDSGDRARGNDAWGYGLHPGQYGMLVLSRFPIDVQAVRTFQKLKWSAMPDARQPIDPVTGRPWYPAAVWSQLRLSSKSHWDVPVRTPRGTLHLLASHPTPPVFDGPEDRNGARNHDEIRLWREYLSAPNASWLCDDSGTCGGLPADATFVIAGDLNADPHDGDGHRGAIRGLLSHPRVNDAVVPRSVGATVAAAGHGLQRVGDTGSHTGDFGPRVGTLRLDYVLPSSDLLPIGSGVHWPPPGAPEAEAANASDHRLVWVDLLMPR
ncbi:endonuclease/exonuclease/phosphatase family protein [Lysobacter sp. A3-1-A15]|uniref:endonuclease/exonuclease/phosphatase family protein n=1 Tax=Novilysobacter viscosus TaxID=3098602 RepID=UPI002EDA2554